MRFRWAILIMLASCSNTRIPATETPVESLLTDSPTPTATNTPERATSTPESTETPIYVTATPEPTPTIAPTPDAGDLDGDGWRTDGIGLNDCDDSDATIHPGGREICGTFDDEDCNGLSEYASTQTDADRDGWFNCSFDGSIVTDCADWNATVYPNASEYRGDNFDADCDGMDE